MDAIQKSTSVLESQFLPSLLDHFSVMFSLSCKDVCKKKKGGTMMGIIASPFAGQAETELGSL